MFDLIIKDGLIVDGTGKAPYRASIGIRNGLIEALGSLADASTARSIDATGLHVTPGFIDAHGHSDSVVLFESGGENLLGQGITTQVAGNCGDSVIPLSQTSLADMKTFLPREQYGRMLALPRDSRSIMEHIAGLNMGVNLALMAGHGTIRSEVMGLADDVPSGVQMERMKALFGEALEAGAFGLTSGLIYPPGVYAREEEIIELCKVAATHGGVYASHMRNESDRVADSVSETIRVAEKAGLPALISHHKIAGKRNWGKSKETIALVERASRDGLTVRVDQYPYYAGATNLLSALPPRYAVDGPAQYVKKLADDGIRRDIRALLESEDAEFDNLIRSCGFGGVLVLGAPATPYARGKTIREIAHARGEDPVDVIFELLIVNGGNVPCAFTSMCEEDIVNILRCPYTMGGTDSYFVNNYLSCDHPRFRGCFVKILSEYVRDKKVLPLEEAVRKLTSMPAALFGMKTKGILEPGRDADIAVFDYAALRAPSDFERPLAPNIGVKYVLVHGTIAWKDDAATGARAGRLLYRR